MPHPPQVAVLTGDLIGSSEVAREEIDRAFALLAETAHQISEWVGSDTRLTRFRGDGWQMLVSNPGLALRAAMIVLARMRAPDSPLATRVSIGIGPITSVGTKDLSDANGDAFATAGHGLDVMPRDAILDIGGQVSDLHLGFVILASTLLQNWTSLQAEAVRFHLHPDQPPLKDIARRLGISPQATNYRVRGATGNPLRQALTFWESDAALRQLEREN